jgi:hypothetical protein
VEEVEGPKLDDFFPWPPRIFLVSKPNFSEASSLGIVRRILSRPWLKWQVWIVKIFGGHYSVLKSVFLGFRAAGIRIRLNPKISNLPPNSTVLVLSGDVELRKLLALPKTLVTVGPNFHNDIPSVLKLLEDPKVINVLVPSPWVADLYRYLYPSINEKIVVWAAAAEVPRAIKALRSIVSKKRVLVYAKGNRTVVQDVGKMLSMQGHKFSQITYGKHSRLSYILELARAKCVIYVGRTESQGLALQEAWAMSLKTFVYQDNEFFVNHFGHFPNLPDLAVSNPFAPYLSSENGAFWTNLLELEFHLGSNEPTIDPKAGRDVSLPAFPKFHTQAVANLLGIMCTDR